MDCQILFLPAPGAFDQNPEFFTEVVSIRIRHDHDGGEHTHDIDVTELGHRVLWPGDITAPNWIDQQHAGDGET